MGSSIVALFLIGFCCLALVNKSNAECCTGVEELTYSMSSGKCQDVGGYGVSPDKCYIIICADGVARVGIYCGQSSCNVFGCNCGGGCLRGDWSRSFVEKNKQYGIQILNINRMGF